MHDILVIHPKDTTTDFLKVIYEDLKCDVINTRVSKSELKKSIQNHKRIIMLGHGTDAGLIYDEESFIIDSTLVYLLREKSDSVFIWCNANMFVDKYKLKGFTTGMIISDWEESCMFNIDSSMIEINESNEFFADTLKTYIPLNGKEIFSNMKYYYIHPHNKIIEFNSDNIFYY